MLLLRLSPNVGANVVVVAVAVAIVTVIRYLDQILFGDNELSKSVNNTFCFIFCVAFD